MVRVLFGLGYTKRIDAPAGRKLTIQHIGLYFLSSVDNEAYLLAGTIPFGLLGISIGIVEKIMSLSS
jgi:hypothetical protein